MLQTQVAYWTYKETARHNLETEKLGWSTLEETTRHNVAVETETHRHNVAQEDYWNASLAETQRHNVAQESYWTNSLTEAARHNVVQESIGWYDAETGRINAFTNQMNAATNRMNAITNQDLMRIRDAEVMNNYNLGVAANNIAQQNADVNTQNATTRWLEWTTSDSMADIQSQNADTNYTNAMTNVQNAKTNRQNANINQQKVNTQKVQTGWNIMDGLFDDLIQGVNTGLKIWNVLGGN